MIEGESPAEACRWCGNDHPGDYCPVVAEISYFPDGTVRRVQFVVTTTVRTSIAEQIKDFKAGGQRPTHQPDYQKLLGRE